MRHARTILLPAALPPLTSAPGQVESPQGCPADIQLRTLEVTRNKGILNARVVVHTENDDDAQNARLLILLPIGVGLERLAPACAATPGSSMVPALRATVTCELGVIPDRGFREVVLSTTAAAIATLRCVHLQQHARSRAHQQLRRTHDSVTFTRTVS